MLPASVQRPCSQTRATRAWRCAVSPVAVLPAALSPSTDLANEAITARGRSQARSDDSYDLEWLRRGATRGARNSLNAMADRLTEQLAETADALVRPPRTGTAGTSLGVRTSIIEPVPRRPRPAAIAPSSDLSAVSLQRPPSPTRFGSWHESHLSGLSPERPVFQDTSDDDVGDDPDVDEQPVRLAQVVSPTSGKTRTVVYKRPEFSSIIPTSVGNVELPDFMRSKQVKPSSPFA